MSRKALGAVYSECVTMARLLVPTHSYKVDQGVSPVVDCLHIDLADFLRIRCFNNANSLGIRHGGPKREIYCTISVVHIGWYNDAVKCRSTHKAKSSMF